MTQENDNSDYLGYGPGAWKWANPTAKEFFEVDEE